MRNKNYKFLTFRLRNKHTLGKYRKFQGDFFTHFRVKSNRILLLPKFNNNRGFSFFIKYNYGVSFNFSVFQYKFDQLLLSILSTIDNTSRVLNIRSFYSYYKYNKSGIVFCSIFINDFFIFFLVSQKLALLFKNSPFVFLYFFWGNNVFTQKSLLNFFFSPKDKKPYLKLCVSPLSVIKVCFFGFFILRNIFFFFKFNANGKSVM